MCAFCHDPVDAANAGQRTKCIAPYYYKDNKFSGIRATHWLSGSRTQDYGSLTLMPVTDKLKTSINDFAVSYRNADETSAANYYKINLEKYHVTAEVTALARSGILRFTMQRADSLYLLVMPNSDKGKSFVKINKAAGEIVGYNPAYRIYQGIGRPARCLMAEA